MSLLDALYGQPAPIDGRFVKRVQPLGPDTLPRPQPAPRKWKRRHPIQSRQKPSWTLLTYEKARRIRLLLAEGWSMRECAERYGVSTSTINNVKRYRVWKDA